MTAGKQIPQEQIVALSRLVDLIFSQDNDLANDFRNHPEAVATIPPWAALYDLPYAAAIGLLVHVMGMQDQIRELSSTLGPVDVALEFSSLEMSPEHAQTLAASTDLMGTMLGLTMLLEASARSMSLYGRNMHALLAEDDVESICNAVSIDPTCVAAPIVQRRLLQEAIVGGSALRKAIGKVLSRDAMVHQSRTKHQNLRLLYAALTDVDSQAVWGMSEDERYKLFSEVLRRYDPDGKMDDPARSLTATFRHWEKEIRPAK